MKNIIAGFFLLGLLVINVEKSSAQVLMQTDPKIAGMSSSKIENLDKLIQNYIEAGKIPGGVFLVARGGNLIYQ